MTAAAKKAEAVTREIRACFNRLKVLGGVLHHDLGVTAAMRAVVEALYESGEQTVPHIARSKSVTRQHIQVIVNDLVEAGLVVTRANPGDKRSPLVALTKKGRTVFERMRQREKTVFVELTRAFARCDLDATLTTLNTLHSYLDSKLKQGDSND